MSITCLFKRIAIYFYLIWADSKNRFNCKGKLAYTIKFRERIATTKLAAINSDYICVVNRDNSFFNIASTFSIHATK